MRVIASPPSGPGADRATGRRTSRDPGRVAATILLVVGLAACPGQHESPGGDSRPWQPLPDLPEGTDLDRRDGAVTRDLAAPGWTALPGDGLTLSAPTAVVDQAGIIHLFVRGYHDTIWACVRDGSTWSSWREMPGGMLTSSEPQALVDASGTIHLFVRRSGDNAVCQIQRGGGSWSAWSTVTDGLTPSGVAGVATQTGVIQLFVRSLEDRVYTNRNAGPGWGSWTQLPGEETTPGAPAAAIDAQGKIPVIVQAPGDSVLSTKGDGTTWEAWSPIDQVKGKARTRVASARDAQGALHLWLVDAGNEIWESVQTAAWSAPRSLAGKTPDTVAPVLAGSSLLLFIRGMDDHLFYLEL